MIKAVIDLGTNTFNILIARIEDNFFEILWSGKEGVSLGMGGINEKIIAPDAFQRGLETMERFKQFCDDWKVVQINAIGTSALRDAVNSLDFIEKVKKLTGIEIKIISGEIEAELIYKGVNLTYKFKEPAMIMDIGGGSTEFIFADENGIFDLISLNIGVSRMYQEFQTSDPLTKEGAGAHELHVTRADGGAVPHRIRVLQRPLEHVGEDLHVAVAVGAEPHAGRDTILVDDAQRAEAHAAGIVVVGEREAVKALEPAVVGEAAFGRGEEGRHRISCADRN